MWSGLLWVGKGAPSGNAGTRSTPGRNVVAYVQVEVGIDSLGFQRIQKTAEACDCDRVQRRIGAGGENTASGLGVAVGRRIHVMQPDQVDTQAAQALGHSGGVLRFGKAGAKGEVDAKQAYLASVGCSHELAIADHHPVLGCNRLVQKTEIRSAGKTILVYRKRVESLLCGARQQRQQKDGGKPHAAIVADGAAQT